MMPLDDKEKTVSSDDFFAGMERQAVLGARIVKTIVFSGLVLLALDCVSWILIFGLVLVGYFTKLIIGASIYYRLYRGFPMLRGLYAFFCVFNVFLSVFLVVQLTDRRMLGPGGFNMKPVQIAAFWATIAHTAISAAYCFLLMFSESVREFLYKQSTKW